MAQKVQVSFVDDLDGSEAEGTIRFGIDGREYEIDLSKKNADKLSRAVQPFIDKARKAGARFAGRRAVGRDLPERRRRFRCRFYFRKAKPAPWCF